jgi:putative tricarboxylic transport membrane protein
VEKSDRVPGVFFVLLSLFACQQSVGIGLGTFRHPGPGFLPFSAGGLIGILAFWCLIQSMISKKSREGLDSSEDAEAALPKIRLLLICLSLFAYTIAVSWLGFILSTFIFVLFIFYVVEPQRWWRIVIKAILITIGNYILFVFWLKVNLPKGILGW